VPAATYTDINLTNGSTYYYVVSGTNNVGESANCAQVYATPSASASVPATPTGLAAYSAGGGVGLTWSAVSGATSYNVKRATASGGPYTTLFYGLGQAIPSFTDLSAGNLTTYYYVVTAVNANGESASSGIVSGHGLPAKGVYSLKNRASGLMLDSIGRTTNGSNCGQWADNPSYNQQWLLSYISTSVVKLECQTGQIYLDGVGRTPSGSILGLWGSNASNNQSWTLVDVGGGYYKLKNLATGLCADAGASPWTNGENVIQTTDSGSTSQQWQFVAP
jgi:hypothetical protein